MRYQEHQRLDGISSPHEKWKEGMRLPSKQEKDRWFFRWQWNGIFPGEEDEEAETDKRAGYYTTYVIGAQWFNDEKPLVITPKAGCSKIDFLQLFSRCLQAGFELEAFSEIYGIDMEQPRIKAPELQSVLSPLIVVHFLSVVRAIVQGGLKKDYIQREENLKKVKGHISVLRHERTNVLRKRPDKVFCRYQEYSVDIPENRLLKKALNFVRQLLQTFPHSESRSSLEHTLNQCLSAFAHVSDEIEVWELKHLKHQKLFRTYSEAIRLAQLILRRYDYSLTNIQSSEEDCPVFWLDMPLLYEHYVLGLLREAYEDQILYQAEGSTGLPDFICLDPRLVIDTKYIPSLGSKSKISPDIIRQLSGYARDRKLFKDPVTEPIPCLVIYPEEGSERNPFRDKPLRELLLEIEEEKSAWGFYRLAVPLPTLR
jgi:hypothetical protein